GKSAAAPAAPPPARAAQQPTTSIAVSDVKRIRVPSLLGLPIRKVIEQATAAGLQVEIAGSGTVREQVPTPGTLVDPGTKIVVRCGR
ncbi:MAG: PASTA domain-containing protein, partial [Terracidiphilus sp.]